MSIDVWKRKGETRTLGREEGREEPYLRVELQPHQHILQGWDEVQILDT